MPDGCGVKPEGSGRTGRRRAFSLDEVTDSHETKQNSFFLFKLVSFVLPHERPNALGPALSNQRARM